MTSVPIKGTFGHRDRLAHREMPCKDGVMLLLATELLGGARGRLSLEP